MVGGGSLALAEVSVMPGSSMFSSWKYVRAATRSLLNSRARCVPAATGAVNRGHSEALARESPGRLRDAGFARASWTAPTKRVHRSAVSWAVVFGRGGGA